MGLVSRETVTRAEYAVIAGPQIHASSHASLTAAIATIGSTEVDLLIANTTTCTANTTVPSNVRLVMTRQGRINQGTYTLTINGPFGAGLSQVFTGTGDVTFGLGSVAEGYPEWWGAKGDGITNSTTALNSAIAACHRTRLSIGTYLTSGMDVDGFGKKVIGASGYDLGSSSTYATRIKAYGTGITYLASSISRISTFQNILFDGNFQATTVFRIYSPSLKIMFKECTFANCIVDSAGDGSSNGKLVWNDSAHTRTTGPFASIQGDNMLFEDCDFIGDTTAATKAAEAVRIDGSNAFLCTFRRCMFSYARIEIAIVAGGAFVSECELEHFSVAGIYYTSASMPLTVEKSYTESQNGSFLVMSAPSVGVGSPIIIRNNHIGTGGTAMSLNLSHPILIEGNTISGNVALATSSFTKYPKVVSIRNSFMNSSGYTGTQAADVDVFGDVKLSSSTNLYTEIKSFALSSAANGNAGVLTLTANSATTVINNQYVKTGLSHILLTPTSANAAASGVYVSAITDGVSFTLTHTNTAATDKTFNYLINDTR